MRIEEKRSPPPDTVINRDTYGARKNRWIRREERGK